MKLISNGIFVFLSFAIFFVPRILSKPEIGPNTKAYLSDRLTNGICTSYTKMAKSKKVQPPLRNTIFKNIIALTKVGTCRAILWNNCNKNRNEMERENDGCEKFSFAQCPAHGGGKNKTETKDTDTEKSESGEKVDSKEEYKEDPEEERHEEGKLANPNEFPFLIRIVQDMGTFKRHFLGTLIHHRFVLTAAHCLYNAKQPTLEVIAGDYSVNKTDSTEQIRRVDRFILHPDWDLENYENDIALIQLKIPFKLNKNVRPLSLSNSKRKVGKGWALLPGWGDLEFDTFGTDLLHSVNASIWDEDECKVTYDDAPLTVTPHKFCAGKNEKGACHGNEGGPVLQKDGSDFTLIGIMSFQGLCGEEADVNYPTVHTKVSDFVNWISIHATGS